MSIDQRPIRDYLTQLGDRAPTPGGGAAAALHAAQAAALVEMVARYSDRAADAAENARAAEIAHAAATLRTTATELMQQDIDGFTAVSHAYGLPRETESDKLARRAAIAAASLTAARPAADVISVATAVLDLAERLEPIANANVITDVAAAADAARAALSTGRINVEINLSLGGSGTAETDDLRFISAGVDELMARADMLSAKVRARL